MQPLTFHHQQNFYDVTGFMDKYRNIIAILHIIIDNENNEYRPPLLLIHAICHRAVNQLQSRHFCMLNGCA